MENADCIILNYDWKLIKMKKIKLLYVVSTLRRSGPTNQLLGIIKNLDKSKFEPQILTLSSEPNNTRLQEFLDCDIKVESLNLSRVQGLISGSRILKEKIGKIKPSIIHTSGVRADELVNKLQKRNSFRHVMTVRNFAVEDYKAKFGKIVGSILAFKGIQSIKNGEIVVFCSYSLKEKYNNYKIKNNRLKVIQNGVDTTTFKPVIGLDKTNLKSDLGFSSNEKIVVFTGSLIPRKNPLMLIEAFKKVKIEDAILVMLGDGSLKKDCIEKSNSNIKVLGEVNNVKEFLNIADVFVSPSSSEGLPNSVIEAASMDLPLLLSNINEHKEIKGDSKKPSIEYFDLGNIDEISKKIEMLLSSKCSGNNREHINERFSMQKMSSHYADLYKDITV